MRAARSIPAPNRGMQPNTTVNFIGHIWRSNMFDVGRRLKGVLETSTYLTFLVV